MLEGEPEDKNFENRGIKNGELESVEISMFSSSLLYNLLFS